MTHRGPCQPPPVCDSVISKRLAAGFFSPFLSNPEATVKESVAKISKTSATKACVLLPLNARRDAVYCGETFPEEDVASAAFRPSCWPVSCLASRSLR